MGHSSPANPIDGGALQPYLAPNPLLGHWLHLGKDVLHQFVIQGLVEIILLGDNMALLGIPEEQCFIDILEH